MSNRPTWDFIAATDPDWGVLTQGSYRSGTWTGRLDEFYASGQAEVERLLADPLLVDVPRDVALDFGCGTGRLSFALARAFRQVYAIDASPTMLKVAEERGAERRVKNVQFVLSDEGEAWPKRASFVLSLIVLQHIESKAEIQEALCSLARCLVDDGRGVVEMPSQLSSRRAHYQLKLRLHRLLNGARVPRRLYARWLHGMSMSAIAVPEFEAMLARAGLAVAGLRSYVSGGVTYVRYIVKPAHS